MVVLRIVLLIGLAWLIWQGFARYRSGRQNRRGNHVATVRCERCGTYIPEDDALWHDGHSYCKEHGPSD